MFNFLIFVVLIPATIMLMGAYISGLVELNQQEREEKIRLLKDTIQGYLIQTFGYGTAKIFNSIIDAEGTLSYLVYLPQNEWFKAPKYKWYEVYATSNGYNHIEIDR